MTPRRINQSDRRGVALIFRRCPLSVDLFQSPYISFSAAGNRELRDAMEDQGFRKPCADENGVLRGNNYV